MSNFYTDQNSKYLNNVPTWHAEHSPWKAKQILSLLNHMTPEAPLKKIVEVGCGAGEILNVLHSATAQSAPPPQIDKSCVFKGFDIAPDAIALAKPKEKDRLNFYHADFLELDERCDLLLAIDVFEHVDSYYDFLKRCHDKAEFYVFGIPLDISLHNMIQRHNIQCHYKEVGHIHFFCLDTALVALDHAGFGVVETRLVSKNFEEHKTTWLRWFEYQLFRGFGKRWAANIVGGHTLYVLVRQKSELPTEHREQFKSQLKTHS